MEKRITRRATVKAVRDLSRELSDKGAIAVRLALEVGLGVYRLAPGGKTRASGMTEEAEPVTRNGEDIRQRWAKQGDANVGYIPSTGGLLVVDADRGHRSGVDGVSAFEHLCASWEIDLDGVPQVVTPNGGRHYVFSNPDGVSVHPYLSPDRTRDNMIAGIDVCGNQNVVAVGSETHKGEYRWHDDECTIFNTVPKPFPAPLLGMCRRNEKKVAPGDTGYDEIRIPIEKFVKVVLDREVGALAKAKDGSHNNALAHHGFTLARLVAAGHLEEDIAESSLAAACDENGYLAKTDGAKGFAKTWRSCLAGASEVPRYLKVDEKARAEESGPAPFATDGEESESEPEPVETNPVVERLRNAPRSLHVEMRRAGETGLAAGVVWMLRDKWRWAPEGDRHYCWTGKVWETGPSAEATLRQLIREALYGVAEVISGFIPDPKAAGGYRAQAKKLKTINSVWAIAKTHACLRARVESFDAKPDILVCDNGTVEMQEGTFTESFDQDMLITRMTDVAFPGWDADWRELAPDLEPFLKSTFDDDETIDVVHRYAGVTMTGHPVKRCLLMKGPASSGKGVMMHVMQTAMGGEYSRVLPVEVLSAGSGGPVSSVAQLPGRRMAFIEDTGDKVGAMKFNGSMFKSLTSGGDTIEANEKYKPAFQFKPQCKLWIATNKEPRFPSESEAAYKDRLAYIHTRNRHSDDPEEHVFGARQMDKRLKSKITKQAPGVLLWAVLGARKFYETWDVGTSKRMRRDASVAIENSRSNFSMFIREHGVTRKSEDLLDRVVMRGDSGGGAHGSLHTESISSHYVTVDELFFAYQGWLMENDPHGRMKMTKIGMAMAMSSDIIENNERLVGVVETSNKCVRRIFPKRGARTKYARGYKGLCLDTEAQRMISEYRTQKESSMFD